MANSLSLCLSPTLFCLEEPFAGAVPISINIGNHEGMDHQDGVFGSSARFRYRGMPDDGRTDDSLY